MYRALTEEVHAWWDAANSYSGDAANFYLEPRALGCFCEKLPGGGSIAHMQVVYVEPGAVLRMLGGLGPLQGMGQPAPWSSVCPRPPTAPGSSTGIT